MNDRHHHKIDILIARSPEPLTLQSRAHVGASAMLSGSAGHLGEQTTKPLMFGMISLGTKNCKNMKHIDILREKYGMVYSR